MPEVIIRNARIFGGPRDGVEHPRFSVDGQSHTCGPACGEIFRPLGEVVYRIRRTRSLNDGTPITLLVHPDAVKIFEE